MRRFLLPAVTLTLALGPPPARAGGLPPQQVHREGFAAVGDEAFGILRQFYDLDESLPLDPRSVEEWTTEAARFEKVVFTTTSGERVPGALALPVDGAPPYPVAVLVHGLGSSGDRWWEDDRRALADGLLARQVAVFTLDLRFHGERAAANDYQSPVYLTLGNTLFVRNRDMMIQSTLDVRRALDYLAGRSDLDPARQALVGYSLGGMIAIYLAALEPRLAAVVACAVPTTDQPTPVDPFQFAPRATVPVRLEIGREDWLSSPADARRLLGLLGSRDKDLRLYEAGHALPPVFLVDAAAWVIERLTPR